MGPLLPDWHLAATDAKARPHDMAGVSREPTELRASALGWKAAGVVQPMPGPACEDCYAGRARYRRDDGILQRAARETTRCDLARAIACLNMRLMTAGGCVSPLRLPWLEYAC